MAIVEGGPEDNNPEVQGEDGEGGDAIAIEESEGVDVVSDGEDHGSSQGDDRNGDGKAFQEARGEPSQQSQGDEEIPEKIGVAGIIRMPDLTD